MSHIHVIDLSDDTPDEPVLQSHSRTLPLSLVSNQNCRPFNRSSINNNDTPHQNTIHEIDDFHEEGTHCRQIYS